MDLGDMIKAADSLEDPPDEHVDAFIDEPAYDDKPELGDGRWARWVLHHFRLSAMLRSTFAAYINPMDLFCTYEGVRYRCTGASRLGDVWLTTKFKQTVGYEKRVEVRKCLHWSDEP